MTTTKRSLIVVVGAGASLDCAVPGFPGATDNLWLPPLTKDLFASRGSFLGILQEYPYAISAATEFVRRNTLGEKLQIEAFLRERKEARNHIHQREFHHVVLYLQRLFWEISRRYFLHRRHGNAYLDLLTQIHSRSPQDGFSDVCLVSMNYDLLLDLAVETKFGVPLSRIDLFLDFYPRWSLVKFHGSVNWAIQVKVDRERTVQRVKTFDFVKPFVDANMAAVEPADSPIMVVDPEQIMGGQKDSIFYPALSVPVLGKYQPVCPENQIHALRRALSADEIALLIIGFSARDKDIMDELKSCWPRLQWLNVVNGDKERGIDVIRQFEQAGFNSPAYRFTNSAPKDMGFSQYVIDPGGLPAFLKYTTANLHT